MPLPEIKIRMTSDTRHAESGVERVTDDLNRLSGASDRATTRTARLGTGIDRMGTRFGGLQRGVQNAAFQVGDFAVQVGMGTAASRALALQLPQLLGGFGVLGAVIGAAVAVAFPLREVLKGLKDEGKGLGEVWGTLQPVVDALGQGLKVVGEFAHSAAETIINNVDRILIIGATAAAFFAGRWVAAFIAARVATFSLSAALVALRGALIRTGIGALIVGIGEAIYQFTRLTKAAGTFGEALGLLKDVAAEVWQRIKIGAEGLQWAMHSAATGIAASFVDAFAWIGEKWDALINSMATPFNGIMESIGSGVRIGQSAIGSGLRQAADSLRQESGAYADAASENFDWATAPLESIQKIRDLLSGMKDERITLPDILGVGDDEDGKGGKGKKAKSLKEKLSDQEKRIKEHLDRIKNLTKGTLSDKLGAWGEYFDNLVTMTGTNNDRLLAIGKSFAAAQALIDAWSAHNRVLADPTLPWWARIASAASVLAAGIGAVNAIRGVSKSGGGSGGGGSAGGQSATQRIEKFVTLDIQGNGLNANDKERLISSINSALDDGFVIKGAMAS